MVTKIFQFGPWKAEQFTFKDFIKSNKNTDFLKNVTNKIRLVFGGP